MRVGETEGHKLYAEVFCHGVFADLHAWTTKPGCRMPNDLQIQYIQASDFKAPHFESYVSPEQSHEIPRDKYVVQASNSSLIDCHNTWESSQLLRTGQAARCQLARGNRLSSRGKRPESRLFRNRRSAKLQRAVPVVMEHSGEAFVSSNRISNPLHIPASLAGQLQHLATYICTIATSYGNLALII